MRGVGVAQVLSASERTLCLEWAHLDTRSCTEHLARALPSRRERADAALDCRHTAARTFRHLALGRQQVTRNSSGSWESGVEWVVTTCAHPAPFLSLLPSAFEPLIS
eukprot:COSAG01_NODE_17404_length_1154_cov_1.466351_2_plen_106_part_01